MTINFVPLIVSYFLKSLFTGTRNTRSCLTCHPVYKHEIGKGKIMTHQPVDVVVYAVDDVHVPPVCGGVAAPQRVPDLLVGVLPLINYIHMKRCPTINVER